MSVLIVCVCFHDASARMHGPNGRDDPTHLGGLEVGRAKEGAEAGGRQHLGARGLLIVCRGGGAPCWLREASVK